MVTLRGHHHAPIPPEDPAVRAAAHLLHAEFDRRLRRPGGARRAGLSRDEGPARDVGAVHRGRVPARVRVAAAHGAPGPAAPAPRAAGAVPGRGLVLRSPGPARVVVLAAAGARAGPDR